MDAFPDRHAYRCVPMTVANTHGWELLVPASFEVEWNGGSRRIVGVDPLSRAPAAARFELADVMREGRRRRSDVDAC